METVQNQLEPTGPLPLSAPVGKGSKVLLGNRLFIRFGISLAKAILEAQNEKRQN